ncbi:sialidase family protein [Bremerella alba]|uniref:Sialidase domain-containing protein n=1 Tax=Bremerella alba TaxID=980252 RepID=A0A7V9A9N6_9BACT|nr:sialidase family protein [Bremerella alba]MBA2117662.1 hypothetical protein [Bremerella alba]
MKINVSTLFPSFLFCLSMVCPICVEAKEPSSGCVTIVSREVSETASPFYRAIYADTEADRLTSSTWQSDDNGQSWRPIRSHHKLSHGLPDGYRRNPTTAVLDREKNILLSIVNSLDTPKLNPKIAEPPIAQKTYYLRYRVSEDGGRTWLCDDPIVEEGAKYDAKHPFDDLWIGKNAVYLGDNGCAPIVTQSGRVLVPAQMTIVDDQGNLVKPPKAHTYTEAVVLQGQWQKDGRLAWTSSERVAGDVSQTCRGLIEPTIVQAPDGRILMVMRGSNSHDPNVPASKWMSFSEDEGQTWSHPQRWTYDDGTPFYSPSSMSVLMRHSSGRMFWIGNITPENASGNLPRFPLVLGEVDPQSLMLIRSSTVIIDQKTPPDADRGRLDLSHVHLMEDRKSGELILTYPRAHQSYREREYVLARLRSQPLAIP